MRNIGTWILIFVVTFLLGAMTHKYSELKESEKTRTVRISGGSLMEINALCGGEFQDIAANQEYVYANCKGLKPKPVTVQNYIFK